MPQASKDMLENRRATMAPATATNKTPAHSGIAASKTVMPGSPSSRNLARMTPGASSRTPHRSSDDSPDSSPVVKGIPRGIASPGSRLPKSSGPSTPPIAGGSSTPPIGAGTLGRQSGLPRSGASTFTSRLQPKGDLFSSAANGGAKPSMQPLSRAPKTPSRNDNLTSDDAILRALDSAHDPDLSRSVDALKSIQEMLRVEPESFIDHIPSLIGTLLDQLDRAFTPIDNLQDPAYFRLLKHVLQSLNALTTNVDLCSLLSYDDIYAVTANLTLRMVQADPIGGQVGELTRFMNMLLIQLLASADRKLVFKAMFTLLHKLIADFRVDNVQPGTETANHADLVIKCLWKRQKIIDDDLKSGRLAAGTLLGILEEFMQDTEPSEYRQRSAEGIALGDLPLRTVKAIIQKVVGQLQDSSIIAYQLTIFRSVRQRDRSRDLQDHAHGVWRNGSGQDDLSLRLPFGWSRDASTDKHYLDSDELTLQRHEWSPNTLWS